MIKPKLGSLWMITLRSWPKPMPFGGGIDQDVDGDIAVAVADTCARVPSLDAGMEVDQRIVFCLVSIHAKVPV